MFINKNWLLGWRVESSFLHLICFSRGHACPWQDPCSGSHPLWLSLGSPCRPAQMLCGNLGTPEKAKLRGSTGRTPPWVLLEMASVWRSRSHNFESRISYSSCPRRCCGSHKANRFSHHWIGKQIFEIETPVWNCKFYLNIVKYRNAAAL